MILKNGDSLRAFLGTAPSIVYAVDFTDHTTSGATDDRALGVETTAGSRTICAGPAASTQRQIRQISVQNEGVAPITVRIDQHDGTTSFARSPQITLKADEQLVYRDATNTWQVITAQGTVRATQGTTVVATSVAFVYKTGTAPEAAGQFYSFSKDGGAPGAWSPGTPGLSGRATDGTLAADAGCIFIPNAAPGNAKYLAGFGATSTVATTAFVWDYMLVNTGIVVTTTTAQTLNTVTLPARDFFGTTDGVGVNMALLVTTATTNASAVTTITVSYTNSDGVPGRTGNIPSFPATAVLGTIVPINLQAGDKGVRSVQSITLGTTLAAGAISLVMYRILAMQGVQVAGTGGALTALPVNTRLYDGVCALPVMLASATTAAAITYQLALEEKA
jgi:hypothetical protein